MIDKIPSIYDYMTEEQKEIMDLKYNYKKLLEFVKSIVECEVRSSRVKWMIWDRAKELLKEIGEL